MSRRNPYALACLVVLGLALTTVPASAGPKSPQVSVTWTTGPALPFDATRWDGELYKPTKRVYLLGFRKTDGSTDGSVWYYDAVAHTYNDTGVDMPVPVSNYEVAALTDSTGLGFYIFGGRDATGVIVTTVQVYYPATNTTAVVATDPWPGTTPSGCVSLPATGVTAIANHAIVVGGTAFVANGCVADENSAQTWIYSPRAAPGTRWRAGPPLNMARGYITPAVLGTTVYAIGGDVNVAGSLTAQTIVEKWSPPAGGWDDAAVADLSTPCDESQAFGFASGPLAGDVVLAGCGQWPATIPDTFLYSSGSNSWSDVGAFNEARRNHAAVLAGSTIFVLGGYAADGFTALTSTELGAGGPFAGRPGAPGHAAAVVGKPSTT